MKTFFSFLLVLIIGLTSGFLIADEWDIYAADDSSESSEMLETSTAKTSIVSTKMQITPSLQSHIIDRETALSFIDAYQNGSCQLTYENNDSQKLLHGWRLDRDIIDALLMDLPDNSKIDAIQSYLAYNTDTKNHTLILAAVQDGEVVLNDKHMLYEYLMVCPDDCPENNISLPSNP